MTKNLESIITNIVADEMIENQSTAIAVLFSMKSVLTDGLNHFVMKSAKQEKNTMNKLAPLQNLIDQFERMQGIGHKTAQRMAFYVLGLSDEEANNFAKAITDAHTKIKQCKICCDLADDELCPVCKDD